MAELTDSQRKLFAAPAVMHVATTLPDGAPHSVPVWCRMEGDRIAFFTQEGSRKARNLERDGRVALSITARDNPFHMIQVRGEVTEKLEGETALEVIDRLSGDYIGQPFAMRSGIVFLVEPRRVYELDLPFQPKA